MSDLPPPPPVPLTAVGAVTTPLAASAPTSSYNFKGNEMLGIVFGLVAALVCGLAWYLVVTWSNRQFIYLAIIMGVVVGKAVAYGSGHSKAVNGLIAILIALLGMLGSYYFIDRHFLVEALGADGDVPLWDSFSFAKELVKFGFENEKSQYVFTFIAAALAGGSAFGATKVQPRVSAPYP
jgi:hypothetical protein